jgi:hypothetical protein
MRTASECGRAGGPESGCLTAWTGAAYQRCPQCRNSPPAVRELLCCAVRFVYASWAAPRGCHGIHVGDLACGCCRVCNLGGGQLLRVRPGDARLFYHRSIVPSIPQDIPGTLVGFKSPTTGYFTAVGTAISSNYKVPTLRFIFGCLEEALPCDRTECPHPWDVCVHEDGSGWRLTRPCSAHATRPAALSHDKAPELHSLAYETGMPSSLCDFHAVKAVGDAAVGHGMPELAAVMAVSFKCVRRCLTGRTMDAAIVAHETFVRERIRFHLPYLSVDDVTWVYRCFILVFHHVLSLSDRQVLPRVVLGQRLPVARYPQLRC